MKPRAAWAALAPEQRQAAGAAAALVLAMLLPWYQATYLDRVGVTNNLSAFKVFTFIEAAVLLVAAGVLYLLWARSERRAFHLPGGDGWVITAAGGWAGLLLIWRLFDKPDVQGAAVGVQWGIFVAMGMCGLLIAAGQRIRVAHRPEPPNPVAEEDLWEPPRRRRADRGDRVPVDPTAVTEVLRDRPPEWEGEPPPPLERAPRAGEAPRPRPPAGPDAGTGDGTAETQPLGDSPPDRLF